MLLAGTNTNQGIERAIAQQAGKKGNKGDIFYNRLRRPGRNNGVVEKTDIK